MGEFDKFISAIGSNRKDAVFKEFSNGEENLLYVFLTERTMAKNIFVYKLDCGLREQGQIRFRVNNGSCYISAFQTNASIQRKGVGRNLFNLACAYADLRGASRVYGEINPINDIDGVSIDDEEESLDDLYFKETKALIDIYEKLGTTVTQSFSGEFQFEKTFVPGQVLKGLKPDQIDFIQKIDVMEKRFGLNK